MLSLWLARGPRQLLRWGAAGVVAVSLLPNLSPSFWATRVATPRLFPSAVESYSLIAPGQTVLALPFGIEGESMYWQVEDGFRFRLAGGYLSISLPDRLSTVCPPGPRAAGWPAEHACERELCSFLRFTGTRVILLAIPAHRANGRTARPARRTPVQVGGLFVYELGPGGSGPRSACAR